MVLIVIGLGWVIGLLPVAAWGAGWWMGAAWLLAAAPAVWLAGPLRTRYTLWAAAIAASAVSGFLLERAAPGPPPAWTSLIGSDVTVTGNVASEPDRGLTLTGYVLDVSEISTGDGGRAAAGKLLVYLNQYDRHLPGDRLTVRGELVAPGEGGSSGYRAYLARREIRATMYRPSVLYSASGGRSLGRWLTSQRLAFDSALQKSLPEPEASLAGGIAFGRDDGLDPAVAAQFNRTGLRHLVAVSGSNVTLVAGLMYFLFIPIVGRRWAWIPAGMAIVAYLGTAGLAPSVVRSGIMALTFLGGAAIGRPQSGLPALFAAVIVMTAISPNIARDPGFLLSATATGGILAFYPWLHSGLRSLSARRRWLAFPNWTLQAAALTVSSTVATMPLMWREFGRISLVSPLANVIVEPAFMLAFWASILTAALGRLNADLGVLAGDAAYYPLTFIVGCARRLSDIPGAAVAVPSGSTTLAVAAYALLAPIALVAYRFPAPDGEDSAPARRRRATATRLIAGAAAGATLVAILPVSVLSHPGDGSLTVRFFDLGQGDAAFLTTPHGHQVLIDGGPSGLGLARVLSESMPHWDRSLDLVILSHPQEDHMAGLPEAAARYAVSAVRDNGRDNTSGTFGYFQSVSPSATSLQAGDAFVIDGVRFEVLWPRADYEGAELNDTSLVIRVTYGEVSFLFTGDSEAPVHRALLEGSDVRADVLKVPHHGSKTTDPALFAAVSPSLAVISVGADNNFGHPHPDTLAALSGYRVLRTDQHGTVTVRTHGRGISISTAR
jgi:competence protein ComEC